MTDAALLSFEQAIQAIEHQFELEIKEVHSVKEGEAVKVKFLGRKGPVQDLMKLLKDIPVESKPLAGKRINDLKEKLEGKITHVSAHLLQQEESHQLEAERIDISEPGRRRFLGRKHPVQQMLDETIDVLVGMGFTVQYAPDIETDYYNFESLNYPPDHPARDMQDTFYITDDLLLRTHNTSIQVRVMEGNSPPIRIICPGKCYRNEEVSARSHVFFHQVDVLYIDKHVTFGDLLSTLDQFFAALFGPEVKSRVRPSYFPFVEPGMEVDISCLICKGTGCSLCKHTGWLEVLGAGMVHPEVLRNGGIDPEQYSGFAWGMGIERLVLLKHRIPDIRMFTQNDMRFLEQFPG